MAKQKATPQKRGKLGRRAAATKVVVEFTGRTTLGELAKAADEMVVAAGGKSDVKATGWYVRRELESAAAFGLVQVTRPVDLIVEKAGV